MQITKFLFMADVQIRHILWRKIIVKHILHSLNIKYLCILENTNDNNTYYVWETCARIFLSNMTKYSSCGQFKGKKTAHNLIFKELYPGTRISQIAIATTRKNLATT